YYSLSPLTPRVLHSFPTRRSSDLQTELLTELLAEHLPGVTFHPPKASFLAWLDFRDTDLTEEPADFFLREARVALSPGNSFGTRSEEHTSELQSRFDLVCRLLLEK